MKQTTAIRRVSIQLGKFVLVLGLIADVVFEKNGYAPEGTMGQVRIAVRVIAIIGVALWILMSLRHRRESSSHGRHTESEL